jgi:UDP-N-acetylmuramyl pentapeptide phosphotransferase/UDP-N-acetylglucosamine-1-phosphate transferase
MTGTTLLALLVGVFALSTALSWLLVGRVLDWLRERAILDLPNNRSSHTEPTPRGGGWGLILTVLPVWAAIGWAGGRLAGVAPVLLGATVLMAVSWIDDRRGLRPGLRFLVQAGAVALGLTALDGDGLVFQGLVPFWLDRAMAGFGWLWFVNLFNFMDGIDGLAGGEAVSIGLGLALVALPAGLDPAFAAWGLAVAGAAAGFLVWNWHPARVFMGDVGSVPLGYGLGWLLLALAAAGAWAAALLLPLYFLADATITLLRRAARGEKVWQAHRQHFYQQATGLGRSHAWVTRAVLMVNAVLAALAVLAVASVHWMVALPAGVAAVALLLICLVRPSRSVPA